MNLRKKTIILLFVLFPVFFMECSEEEGYLPGLTGNMVGFVYTFDEFGNLLDDHSDVRITAIGIDGQYAALTDSKGRFELKGLPTGTYEMHFEKEGFGVLKQFGVQHLGGKPTILLSNSSYKSAYFLYEMPTTEITNLTIENDSIYGEFLFTSQEDPQSVFLRLYFSTVNGFDRQSAQYVLNTGLRKNEGRFVRRLYFEDAPPFSPGEEVFFNASIYTWRTYIELPFDRRTVSGIDSYFDFENKETIYPNLGDESAQFSFIFPE